MKFRTLKENEIYLRVSQINEKGLFLLLYKDARVDMDILDETVGAENWQKNYEVVKGNLYCNVGIKTEDGWVWKQDVGTESNTEQEKGEASDAFKRACVCWGIGRELYTAPKIYIPASKCNIKYDDKKGKYYCYDNFEVSFIDYNERREIKALDITLKNEVIYKFRAPNEKVAKATISKSQAEALRAMAKNLNVMPVQICEVYRVDAIEDMTVEQFTKCFEQLQAKEAKQKK